MSEPTIAQHWANNWVTEANKASHDKVAADAAAKQEESEDEDAS